jgi:LPS sulfotransferase NodH
VAFLRNGFWFKIGPHDFRFHTFDPEMFNLLHHLVSGPSCYALCAVARSGAHLLTAGLRATGMAGRPLQYFHALLSLKYGARYGFDATHQFAEYVTGIVSTTATRNHVFGFRLDACDLDRVIGQLRETRAFGSSTASEIQLLRSAFPRLRCIQLTRRDRLRQAISKARAIQTNRWVAGKEGHRNREPVFRPGAN